MLTKKIFFASTSPLAGDTSENYESGLPAGISSGGKNTAPKEAALFQRLYAGAKRLMDGERVAEKAREKRNQKID
jgi:hypothetical protein